jgi:hypothetical protein
MARKAVGAIPPELLARVEHIYLYDEPDALGLNIGYLGGYLAAILPTVEVHLRRDFLTHHLEPYSAEQRETLGRELLAQFARARLDTAPLPVETAPAEEPTLEEFFEGRLIRELLGLLLPPEEKASEHLHLVFTNWRLAQVGEAGELRQIISLFGTPTLISLTGLFEALAAPRRYDFLRAQMAMLGLEEGLEELEEQFAPSLLGPGDPRLNEVLKGLVLQALFSRLWGEAFCLDEDCRLFNAATYEELFHAQTQVGAGLCAKHTAWLREISGAPERA